MKYKQALKHGFFELQSIKEDYLIAKAGNSNPYTMMRFLEVQLTVMNPVVPHFAQYCWTNYVYPIFAKSSNYTHQCHENLCKQAWPTASGPFDKVTAARLDFLRKTKSAIRQGLDAAKAGGKKKGKKGAAEAEPAKVLEKCALFVAREYPEVQKKCLEIL